MAARSRKLSFDILATNTSFEDDNNTSFYRSKSDPPAVQNGGGGASQSPKRNRRKRRNKSSKKKELVDCGKISEESSQVEFESKLSCSGSVVYEEVSVPEEENVVGLEFHNLNGRELRQRNVGSGGEEEVNENVKEENCSGNGKELDRCDDKKMPEMNGIGSKKLETEESLDWKKVMAEDPKYFLSVEKSPLKYFMEEMYGGNSLRTTTSTLANEKDGKEYMIQSSVCLGVVNCTLQLITIGYLVCLDSFLSMLIMMPTRLLMLVWRSLNARHFKRPSAAELSDCGCFIALVCGVILLQQTDISLIYHILRGQGTIKLYVVYNVLEIFDKLFQSFGGDVLQTLFNSAEGLANCNEETSRYWLCRFMSDEALAVTSSIIHSFILLAQAITLSTCVVAHNNALLALLVSNNFAEIKSNVFKRFSKDNVQIMVYSDSIERFHISAFIVFVLAQYILEAEYPWFEKFLINASMVYICEVMIDTIKHSFIAKFNDIKPIVFSEFLEDLCRQRLKLQVDNGKKYLTFIPLAPACVVIRVLGPVYAAHLPHGPFLLRLFWIFLLSAMNFVMLTSLKVMIGMGLQKHATWYVERCQKRKLHCD